MRTRRLLRLQKANSSLAPLPLRFAAHRKAPSLYRPRKASPPLGMGLADVTCRRWLKVACHCDNHSPRVRYLILIIIANIRNIAGFRSRDPLRRKSEWTFAPTPSDIMRSESGGATNVGYDRFDRKRFDTMARSRLRRRGGIRTARNHDARATRQGNDVRSERSESKAGAVFDGRDKTQARRGAGTPARQQGRRRRRSIATRIVDERRKSDRLMSGRERRAAEPPRSVSKMQSAVTNGADSRAGQRTPKSPI